MKHNRHEGTTLVKEFRFIRMVRDLSAMRSFYEEVFDWPIINDWGGGVMYDTGSATFELIRDAQAEKPNTSSRMTLSVPDVSSLFERLKDKVTILKPLQYNTRDAMVFRISDPDGFPITFFTPTEIEK